MTTGQYLFHFRDKKKWTQAGIALKLGITRTLVNRLEADDHYPNYLTLKAYHSLGLDINRMLRDCQDAWRKKDVPLS